MGEPARPVGRPKQFDEVVSVRLPKRLHDTLSREAIRRDVELSDVIRERLNFVSQNSRQKHSWSRVTRRAVQPVSGCPGRWVRDN